METKTTPAELIDDEHKRDTRGRRIAEPHRRAEIIAGYASGGLTQKAYARREGVNDHTLVAWLGQSRRSLRSARIGAGDGSQRTSFCPVDLAARCVRRAERVAARSRPA